MLRYLWLAHRDPSDTDVWGLAQRGQELWAEEAHRAHAHSNTSGTAGCGAPPPQLGYMRTPSMLVARNNDDAAALARRAAALAAAGIDAELLSPSEAVAAEPLLRVPADGGALRVRSDAQLDAAAACTYLLAECEALGRARDRFSAHFGERAELLRMGKCSVRVVGVRTGTGDWHAACAPPLSQRVPKFHAMQAAGKN